MRIRNAYRRGLVAPAFALLAASLALSSPPAGAQQQAAPPPPPVTIAQPVERKVAEWDEFTGRFQAVDTVEVRARVSGYLTEIHFTDGQMVKTGDLLFVIDPRPFE